MGHRGKGRVLVRQVTIATSVLGNVTVEDGLQRRWLQRVHTMRLLLVLMMLLMSVRRMMSTWVLRLLLLLGKQGRWTARWSSRVSITGRVVASGLVLLVMTHLRRPHVTVSSVERVVKRCFSRFRTGHERVRLGMVVLMARVCSQTCCVVLCGRLPKRLTVRVSASLVIVLLKVAHGQFLLGPSVNTEALDE